MRQASERGLGASAVRLHPTGFLRTPLRPVPNGARAPASPGGSAPRAGGAAGRAVALEEEAASVAVVVLTHNRRREILRTLARLTRELPPTQICVVDNGSTDGSAEAVARVFPEVALTRLPRNLGAAGRNYGVQRMAARYVAFCDDDTWWDAGSLERAAALLDAWPSLAVVTARVLVGRQAREDPTSTFMARGDLPNVLGHPGFAASGFLAGACVMRRRAFLAAGGYDPRLFIGGEESLLALDLLAAGWHLAYSPDLMVRHHPSHRRDPLGRRRLLLRNALWCAWLRRPSASAWRETRRHLRAALGEPRVWGALLAALRGLPWILRERRVVPAHVEALLRRVEEAAA